MARRILNRKELREDYDAAERRQQDNESETEEEAERDDENDEGETADLESEQDEEEEEKATRKKRRTPAKSAKPKSRARAKVIRMKVVWGVFNNANQRVAVFDYARRQEADEMAAKLRTDKKTTHFVQPIKDVAR